jgi:hypothetical protein
MTNQSQLKRLEAFKGQGYDRNGWAHGLCQECPLRRSQGCYRHDNCQKAIEAAMAAGGG